MLPVTRGTTMKKVMHLISEDNTLIAVVDFGKVNHPSFKSCYRVTFCTYDTNESVGPCLHFANRIQAESFARRYLQNKVAWNKKVAA